MKPRVSYSAICVVCGPIPGSWSRRRRIARSRGERHRMVASPPEAPGPFHDFDIERRPKLDPKPRGRAA